MNDDVRNHITREALDALDAELERLTTEGRREMADRIRTARAWGDLKENAEYHDAKDAQAHLETRISRLQERRRNAVVVEAAASSSDTAGLGSVVTVVDLETDRRRTHTLVSATESDPARGMLSVDSPLGHALAGARVGDEVAFDAPSGPKRLRVVDLGA